jgi:hypothetical protein
MRRILAVLVLAVGLFGAAHPVRAYQQPIARQSDTGQTVDPLRIRITLADVPAGFTREASGESEGGLPDTLGATILFSKSFGSAGIALIEARIQIFATEAIANAACCPVRGTSVWSADGFQTKPISSWGVVEHFPVGDPRLRFFRITFRQGATIIETSLVTPVKNARLLVAPCVLIKLAFLMRDRARLAPKSKSMSNRVVADPVVQARMLLVGASQADEPLSNVAYKRDAMVTAGAYQGAVCTATVADANDAIAPIFRNARQVVGPYGFAEWLWYADTTTVGELIASVTCVYNGNVQHASTAFEVVEATH